MAFVQDISDWPAHLKRLSLAQITNAAVVEESGHRVRLAPDAKARLRQLTREEHGIWLFWLRFGVGVENLVKAVLLSRHVSIVRNRFRSPAEGRVTDPAVKRVYRAAMAVEVRAAHNVWLQTELNQVNPPILRLMEIGTPTLAGLRDTLQELEQRTILTSAEAAQAQDALQLLADLRRNVDAHISLKMQSGSVEGDLKDIYIPLVNLLLGTYA